MKRTIITKDVEVAARRLRGGGIVAFPTETVYGLGADAGNAEAVRKIFDAKGRPSDNPLIVHISSLQQVGALVEGITPSAQSLMDAFFPGPLTLVMARSESVGDIVTAGLDTVGIRMPDHSLAQRFLRAAGRPVAAPSANRSGRPSPTTWQAVADDLQGRIDLILKGGATRVGLESTVVDCTGRIPVVLRHGSVTVQDLRLVVPDTEQAANEQQTRRSPGTRYRHYRPDAGVVIVESPKQADAGPDSAYIGRERPDMEGRFGVVQVLMDDESYAREVFHFFRRCERQGIETIYCQSVEPVGIGKALMDRLERAAE